MSDQVSGERSWRPAAIVRPRCWLLLLAVVAAAAGVAIAGAHGLLAWLPAALVTLFGLEPPRWIHNLADVLQIATALAALFLWAAACSRRR